MSCHVLSLCFISVCSSSLLIIYIFLLPLILTVCLMVSAAPTVLSYSLIFHLSLSLFLTFSVFLSGPMIVGRTDQWNMNKTKDSSMSDLFIGPLYSLTSHVLYVKGGDSCIQINCMHKNGNFKVIWLSASNLAQGLINFKS